MMFAMIFSHKMFQQCIWHGNYCISSISSCPQIDPALHARAAGNMRAPDKLLCLQWVKKAWESIATEVIINSFKVCSISVETDGSEDGLVLCITWRGCSRCHSKDLGRAHCWQTVLFNTVCKYCMHAPQSHS